MKNRFCVKCQNTYHSVRNAATGSLLAAFWDGSESLVSSHLIGDEVVDSMEYIAVLAFTQAAIGLLIWIGLSVRNRKIYNPF